MTNPTDPSAAEPAPDPAHRYAAPGWATRRLMNPLVAWLSKRGLRLQGAALLEVVGRRSGELRRTPVNPLELDGRTYLVSPRGVTEWSRNARAAGAAVLVAGKRRRAIELHEVPAAERVRVLRAYLDRWRWEVGRFLPTLGKDATDADYAEAVATVPMFLATDRPG